MAAAKHQKWIFSKQELEESPSRKAGIDIEKELGYRQQAANLIQDMGQRLSVNQLTINTAIVYMHRFYVYHSFTVFSRYAIAPTALFLAAKVEEQPKKLQHVLQICHACLHPDKPSLDTHSDAYMKQAQELVQNELVLLQSLGFEISVDHPHTHVVKCTQLVKASRDLSQMAYFMATNSLHLTTFCLLYKPTVVAAMCIHLSCKWSKYEIPLSSDGKPYWSYMDPSVTESLLDTIITEFLKILNRCPTRLRKLKNYQPSQNNKDGQDHNDESKPSQHPQSSSQGSSHPQAKKPSSQPLPPTKEKKQTLSIEEYKKAQAAKTISKVPPPPPQHRPGHTNPSSHQGPPIKLEKTEAFGHSSRSSQMQSHNSTASVKHEPKVHRVKSEKPVPEGHGSDASHKNMMRPPHHPQHVKSAEHQRARTHDGAQNPRHKMQGSHSKSSVATAESVEELAMAKVLEGRMHTEKLQTQQSATEQSHNRPSHQHSRSSDRPATSKDQEKKQSRGEKPRDHEAPVQPSKSFKQYDRKQVVELYHKDPVKLRQYLKYKDQFIPLNRDEKALYAKLQAKEEERRKRKAAAENAVKVSQSKPSESAVKVGHSKPSESAVKVNQSKPSESAVKVNQSKPSESAVKVGQSKPSESAVEVPCVESPSGPLKLRIKLGSKPEAAKTSSVAKIAASDSESHSSPRKRSHDEVGGHPSSSKQAKRSDKHKHHHHHRSGSSSDNKHRRSHHKHSSSGNEKTATGIDEAVFQKSLSDAMSKVQQQQQTGIPTVTLKRANNGKESNYFMSVSTRRGDFDPNAPVSAEVPDDIFEEEQQGSSAGGTIPLADSLLSAEDTSADASTPESGEIRKESPAYEKTTKHNRTNKAPSLFSPDGNADSQLMRSSSGYHSSQDNDYQPPVLLPNHYVQ